MGDAAPLSRASGLLAYIPPLLAERLAEGTPVRSPEGRQLDAAVALIDVGGFSAMAERMAAQGSIGVERLAATVNDLFGRLVDAIRRTGGSAHCFPGDSVIAVWPATGLSLADATLRAASCAFDLVTASRAGAGALPLKAGIGAGRLLLAHLGEQGGRQEMLLVGPALADMGDAERGARAGEVALSPGAWQTIADRAVGRPGRDGRVMLESIADPLRIPDPASEPTRWLPEAALAVARGYLADALLRQVDAEQGDWLGEFRQLSVLFLRIMPPEPAALLDLHALDRQFRCVQRLVDTHGGTVARMAHDDKGLCALAAMGLPPRTHEDDAERAVLAALAIQDGLQEIGTGSSAGVASGRVYCGPLGARDRREYSLVGSVANLAARLATAVASGVLCDSATATLAGERLRFVPWSPPTPGAGQHGAFRPMVGAGRSYATRPHPPPSEDRGADTRSRPGGTLVGRASERGRAGEWLDMVARGGDHILLLRGDAGIGKSTLLGDLLAHARSAGMVVLEGACERLTSLTAYQPWRSIVRSLLDVDVLDPDAQIPRVRVAVRELLGDDGLAPLVCELLGTKGEDSPLTGLLTGAVRRDNTLAVVARLIARIATGSIARGGGGLLLALEDTHWMDSASWALVDAIRRLPPDVPVGALLTIRTEAEREGRAGVEQLGAGGVSVLDLGALSPEANAQLVEQTLAAAHTTSEVAGYVYALTQGNPLFTEELIASLRESGGLVIADGIARLRVRTHDAAAEIVSTSVRGVLTTRMDRLTAPALLTLKAASVIGQQFDLESLAAIHPLHTSSGALHEQLDELRATGLIQGAAVAGSERFGFKHALTRDVAYGLMLHEQRRRLHRALAEHLERGSLHGGSPAALLHHWRAAGARGEAVRHVDDAARDAMRQGGYREAMELFEYGLEAADEDDAVPAAPGMLQRTARWRAQLAEAMVALGLHDEARRHLDIFLRRVGEPAPRPGAPLALGLVQQIATQLVAPLRLRASDPPGPRAPVWSAASAAYEQLGYIHYAAGETMRGTHAALEMLNLAERARDLPMLARACAAMSLTASVVSLRRLAAVYEGRAIEAARAAGNPLVRAHVEWVAAVRAAGEGRWTRVESGSAGAIEPSERLGDHRLRLMALQTLASGAFLQGDLERALALGTLQLSIAREHGNALWEAWALNTLSEVALARGDDAATIRQCERALAILREERDRSEEIRAGGMLALARVRSGAAEQAWAIAQQTLRWMADAQLTAFNVFAGYAEATEALLRLAEARAAGDAAPTGARSEAARAARLLRRLSIVFPIARPRATVARGRLLALARHRGRARRLFLRAADRADALRMPREAGLALLGLVRSVPLEHREHQRTLARATTLLGTDLRGAA